MGNPSQRHPRYLFRDQVEALRDSSRLARVSSVERILVALDGTELSHLVLPLVRTLMAKRDAEVMLLSVVDVKDGESPIAKRASYLEAMRRSITQGAPGRVRYDIMDGHPDEKILLFAASYKPSIIAMATHGRTGLERLLHGSVTENVIRGSPWPVLTVNPNAAAEPREWRKILVPLDGTERTGDVLPLVADLARVHDAQVTLMHVISSVGDDDRHAAYAAVEAHGVLEPFARILEENQVPVRIRVQFGEPEATIREAALENDLVALTTHGRSGLARWVLGSAAEELLRTCSRPVLVRRTLSAPVVAQVAG